MDGGRVESEDSVIQRTKVRGQLGIGIGKGLLGLYFDMNMDTPFCEAN